MCCGGRGGGSPLFAVFFPVNVVFSKIFMGTFWRSDTFSVKFTRKFMPSGALFWPFSWALFMVHGHQLRKNFRGTFRGSRVLFPQKNKNAGFSVFLRPFRRFTCTFPKFTGTVYQKCARAHLGFMDNFFVFTGTFSGSRAKVSPKFQGHFSGFKGIFAKLFTGTFSRFTGKKL